MEITDAEAEHLAVFRAFARDEVAPFATSADRDGAVADRVVGALAERGYLGAAISAAHGGAGLDEVAFGLLCEAVGGACSSTRSLLTVQSMVGRAIERWGSAAQKGHWLPRLATGAALASFCVTEPEAGSDANAVSASLAREADGYFILTARKRWVTFGLRADVYLVLGRTEDGPTAILVERDTAGVTTEAVHGALGLRGASLADVSFDQCRVPEANVVGKPGVGFSHVVATALDHGRYSVAWGCVGIGAAALADSARYALARTQFGVPIAEHQLVRGMIADMHAGVRSARLLCLAAGRLRERRDPRAIHETMLAKYVAARVAADVTRDAVQIHGANGCGPEHGAERHFRDAKVMQIIEGTDQLLQVTLSDYAYREHGRDERT